MEVNKKTRIFFVNATLSSGGAERVISIIANKFVNLGYEISILTWLDEPVFYAIDSEVKIVVIEKECNSRKLIRKMMWFRRYIKDEKPDLILSFLAIFNVITLASLLGVKKKIVVCERNDPNYTPFGKFARFIRNVIYHYADGILTQSDKNKSYFSKSLQKKIEVIYNPIFLEDHLVGSSLTTEKQKLIISIGRLETQKNQKMLIRAFSIFERNHPDYQLVIYGEGSQRGELEGLVSELNLTGRVLLPGVVKNVFECLQKAEVFVLSSYFEGMPNTLLEAMCIGVPSVSTKVSGAVDLIEDGKNGYLTEIDDCNMLASRIELLADDPELRFKIGERSSHLYDILKVDVISKQWESYIAKCVSKN